MNDGRSNSHRLIFIGGSPRSGTTLVQNMLDCHPAVLGGPEFLHLPDVVELRRKLHSSIDREWIDLLCTRESVDRAIVGAVEQTFLPLADKHAKKYYSEKTPENILVFSELMELFPQAHFIQVVRDPRAVLSSMRQVKQRAVAKGITPPVFTRNYSNSMAHIKRCMDSGYRAAQTAGAKILTVIYEKLIEDPKGEIQRICGHIGIELVDSMLKPGDKEHIGNKAITEKSDNIWYDKKSYNRNVSKGDKEKWRSQLPYSIQIRSILDLSGIAYLKEYGYDFSIAGYFRDCGLSQKLFFVVIFWVLRSGKMFSKALRRFRKII